MCKRGVIYNVCSQVQVAVMIEQYCLEFSWCLFHSVHRGWCPFGYQVIDMDTITALSGG